VIRHRPRREETATADLELLTARQFCTAAQISPATMFRLIARGEIAATHIGHSLRVFKSSVLAYLERQRLGYRPRGSRATLGEHRAAREGRGGR
jgi:hypothetical protein